MIGKSWGRAMGRGCGANGHACGANGLRGAGGGRGARRRRGPRRRTRRLREQFGFQHHQRDRGRRGVDNTGNNQQRVTFIGTFPLRPDTASTTALGPGHGYDDCLTPLAPGGITKVSYNGTTDYIDSPVTWAPS